MSKKKLIRSKKDLPRWFPLKEYAAKLDDKGWLDAIEKRLAIKWWYQITGDVDTCRDRFEHLVIERDGEGFPGLHQLDETTRVKDLQATRDLSLFEAAYISQMIAGSRKGRALQSRLGDLRRRQDFRALWVEPSKAITEARRQDWTENLDQSREPYGLLDVLGGLPIIVDINQDDRAIMSSLRRWLKDVRFLFGPAREPIGPKEFADWRTYAILPYFDLTFWATLHGIRYSETLIADELWPNAKVSGTERLRKVTRVKAAQVFDEWNIALRLSRQIEFAAALARDSERQQT